MQIFRTMEQPDSGDLRALPGYADLSDEARQGVAEQYKTVYAGCQRLGVRVAQGMAYEAAKRMCSDLLKEASELTHSARSDGQFQSHLHDQGYRHEGGGVWKHPKTGDSVTLTPHTAGVKEAEGTETPKPQPPKKKKTNWRDQAYRDLGMNKVKGASGRTYYEDVNHLNEWVHDQAATQDPAHKRTSYHKTLEKHGFNYDHSQKDGKVKRHQWSHPDHGTVSSIHGEGPAEWFHAPHGGQTKGNARSAEHLDHYLTHEMKKK